jgi:hypothetical protein
MIRTNSSRNVTVGTTNRSAATIWLAWLVRNVRHVCDGGRGCRRMYLATVDWLTEKASKHCLPMHALRVDWYAP